MRQYAPFGILVVLLWLAYGENTHEFLGATDPGSPYAGGGLYVPVISLFLVWLKWDTLKQLPVRGSGWGLPLILLGATVCFLGSWSGHERLYIISLVLVLWGLVLWLAGIAMTSELFFPIFFLLFMIPLPQRLENATLPLRLLATKAAAALPLALNMPIVVDGTQIRTSGMTFSVDIACSGLGYLLSVTATATLLAYFAQCGLGRKLLLLAAAAPVAFAANVLRIDATIVMGIAFGEGATKGLAHTTAGVVVYAFAVWALVWIWRLLCRPQAQLDG